MPTYTWTLKALSFVAAGRADMLRLNAAGEMEFVEAVNPPLLYDYINSELAALWDLLISTYEDYVIRRRTIEVVAGTEDYSCPEDFYKFRKIFPMESGSRCAPLRRFNLDDLGEADTLNPQIRHAGIRQYRYKLNGNRIWLHPCPSTAGQMELWYIPQFDPVLNPEDAIAHNFPLGWEQYAAEGAAARLLEVEESDASAQRGRQQEILRRILLLAEDRDAGEPHSMIDTQGGRSRWI